MARIRTRTKLSPGPASVAGAGGSVTDVSGSGGPSSQSSQADGSGTVNPLHAGSGSPDAQSAQAAGSGYRIITGTGDLNAQMASMVAVGVINPSSPIPGSFHYDAVDGNDSNNGILVGETGSGTTLNGVAGTGPRQTAGQFQSDMDGTRYAVGDRIYIHPPGLTFTSAFPCRNGSTSNQGENFTTICALPGMRDETILTLLGELRDGPNSVGAIHMAGSNFRWLSLHILNDGQIFSSGSRNGNWGLSGGAPAYNCRWIDIVNTYNGSNPFGNNGGFWKIEDGNSAGHVVYGCDIEWELQSSSNGGLWYSVYCPSLSLTYNKFRTLDTAGNMGQCIHYKKGSLSSQYAGRIGKNILIHGGNREHLHGNISWFLVDGNLFWRTTSGGNFCNPRSDASSGPVADGYATLYEHNTFYGAGGLCTFEIDFLNNVGSTGTRGWDNGFLSNNFDNTWLQILNGYAVQNHNSDVRFNLMRTGSQAAREFDVNLSVAQLHALSSTGRFDNSGPVSNQALTPAYTGTPSLDDITTLTLTNGFLGHDNIVVGFDPDDCGPTHAIHPDTGEPIPAFTRS